MIHLDTSVLVDALTGPRRSASRLRAFLEDGERIVFSTIVLYEWLRGPRRQEELVAQEALLPREGAIAFGGAEASLAAQLYRSVRRARGREIDLIVAACAIVHGARFWTLDPDDFSDVPDLELVGR